MSILQMVKVWEHEFPHPQQSVMLALADHASDDGKSIFPSIDRIAWKTGYSRRGVQNIMSQLRSSGVLIKTKEATRRTPNEYRFNWSKAKPKPEFRGEESAPQEDEGCNSGADRGANPVHEGCNSGESGVQQLLHPNHQLTVNEPSLEPSKKSSPSKTGRAQDLVDLYNAGKPPAWSECQSLNRTRKTKIESLFSEHRTETITIFRAALVYVCTSDWWREKDMSIDTLLVKGRVLELSEKAQNLQALLNLSDANRKVVSQAQDIYAAIGGDDAG